MSMFSRNDTHQLMLGGQINPYGQDYYGYPSRNLPGQQQPAAMNANQFLGMFNLGGTGLTPDQQAALSNLGVDTGASAISKWQEDVRKNPLVWDTQVPLISQIANEGRYREALGLNTLQGQLAQSQLNQTGQQIQANNASVMGNYDTARRELDMAGQGAITGLLNRERQQIGASQQSLQGRGLGNTSIVDNARRGIQADTGQNIAGVQEQVGQQRSNLATQRGQMQFATGSQLSDFMQNRTRMETGIMGDRINLIQSMNDQAKGNAPSTTTGGGGNQTGQQIATLATAAILAAVI